MTETRSPVVDSLLYWLQFTDRLDDAAADRVARQIVAEPLYDQTIPANFLALQHALESPEPLTGSIPQPHGEQDFRRFVGRVLRRLEELHPWDEPPYRKLSYADPSDFADARAVGRVRLTYADAAKRLGKPFSFHSSEGGGTAVMVLKLRSGEEFVLTGPRTGGELTLRARGDAAPADLVASFRRATGLGDDVVTADAGE